MKSLIYWNLFACSCLLAFLYYFPVLALDVEGYSTNQTLVSEGIERTYDLYTPDSNFQDKRPLVILIHGHLGSAEKIMNQNNPNRGWLSVALRENFIVAIPNGLVGPDGYTGWNDCRKDNTTNTEADDLGFIRLLIQTLIREKAVDPSRVYVTGTSNGGHLSLRLALEAPELIAAAAPVVASMPKISECKASGRPIPVLFINGTADPLMPYAGGQIGKKTKKENRGTALSVDESIAWWVKNNGASPDANHTDFPDRDPNDGSTASMYYYPGPAPVALIRVAGGGHTEPSLSHHYRALFRLIVDGQNKDFETAEVVWNFFKDKTAEQAPHPP